MLTINTSQSRTINNIQFRVYKDNLLPGAISYLRAIESIYQPFDIPDSQGISLYPTGGANMQFALKFDSIERRDHYRDYIFSIGEWQQHWSIKFPEILADYSLEWFHYPWIEVKPYLYLDINDIRSMREKENNSPSIFCGLPIDIEKIIQAWAMAHTMVGKI